MAPLPLRWLLDCCCLQLSRLGLLLCCWRRLRYACMRLRHSMQNRLYLLGKRQR